LIYDVSNEVITISILIIFGIYTYTYFKHFIISVSASFQDPDNLNVLKKLTGETRALHGKKKWAKAEIQGNLNEKSIDSIQTS